MFSRMESLPSKYLAVDSVHVERLSSGRAELIVSQGWGQSDWECTVELSLRKVSEVVRQSTADALEKALEAADPVAKAHVESIRKNHAGITPAAALRRVEWEYRVAVTSTGGAAGLAAFAPNPVAWAATIAEAGVFLTASAALVVATAQVHGLDDLDPLQRRVLVTGILLGNSASAGLAKAVPRTAKHWAKYIVNQVPRSSLIAVNKVLGPNFVTKYGTKQGVLVLGRELPGGIGAVIGGGGNAVFGELVIRASHKAFGRVRESWDE
jgi:hypothetical protein